MYTHTRTCYVAVYMVFELSSDSCYSLFQKGALSKKDRRRILRSCSKSSAAFSHSTRVTGLTFVYTGPPQITNTKSGENQFAIVFEPVIHCWSFSLQHQLAGKIVNILALKSVRLSPLASIICYIFRGSQDLYHLFPFMQHSKKNHGKSS